MSEGDRRAGGQDRRAGGEDRRRTTRVPLKATVSLTVSINGETVDLSARGALVRAKGTVDVVFRYQGHEYQGRLVRVKPTDSGEVDYAIEVRDQIPHRRALS